MYSGRREGWSERDLVVHVAAAARTALGSAHSAVTLLAAVLLGERLAIRRILAILVAFAGALVILRPGLREVGPGHIAMLFTAASFAGGYLIAKIMADEVAPTVVVGMLSLTVTIGLAPSPLTLRPPPPPAPL